MLALTKSREGEERGGRRGEEEKEIERYGQIRLVRYSRFRGCIVLRGRFGRMGG